MGTCTGVFYHLGGGHQFKRCFANSSTVSCSHHGFTINTRAHAQAATTKQTSIARNSGELEQFSLLTIARSCATSVRNRATSSTRSCDRSKIGAPHTLLEQNELRTPRDAFKSVASCQNLTNQRIPTKQASGDVRRIPQDQRANSRRNSNRTACENAISANNRRR